MLIVPYRVSWYVAPVTLATVGPIFVGPVLLFAVFTKYVGYRNIDNAGTHRARAPLTSQLFIESIQERKSSNISRLDTTDKLADLFIHDLF
jgi:hypothetical protein